MTLTIVFDLGGVLFAEGRSVFLNALQAEGSKEVGHMRRILASPESVQLRKGMLSDRDFWSWVKSELPMGSDVNVMRQRWYDCYTIDPDIFRLVRRLYGRYRLVAFSGNIKSRVEYLDKKYDFRRYFDSEVYSFEHHMDKPEDEFFKTMIRSANTIPENIVYIDDKEHKAAPAREEGVNVFIYSQGGINLLKQELRGLGIQC